MRRFFGVVIGLTALAFAGAAPANTIGEPERVFVLPDNNWFAPDSPGAKDPISVESDHAFEGFWDPRYTMSRAYDGRPNGGGLLWEFSDGENGVFELSDDYSTAWRILPNNPRTEVAFLDEMVRELNLGPAPSEIFYDKIDGEGTEFTTSREYFWIKKGDWTAYFRNANPGKPITVVVEGGYSHYGVAGVPIPPAFLLFGSALLGMGWLARRQRARKDREAMAASHPVPAL